MIEDEYKKNTLNIPAKNNEIDYHNF